MDNNIDRILLDFGDLPIGVYKIAVSRIGSNDGTELERQEFYARVTDDLAIELSRDGNWGRFSAEFDDSFRKEDYFRQFMRSLDSVPTTAKVLDVRGVLDTTD